MFYPTLKTQSVSENTITSFGGLDRSPVIPENCFSFTQNTSSSLYPLLSTREKRLTLNKTKEKPKALNTKNGIAVIFGNTLYFNDVPQPITLSEGDSKQIISMGSYLYVFPDGVYINTILLDDSGVSTESGSLSSSCKLTDSTITLYPYVLGVGEPTVAESSPLDRFDGMIWLDTSEFPNRICQYNGSDREWYQLEPTHVRVEADAIFEPFDVGDEIIITGLSDDLDGACVIEEKGEGYISFKGMIDTYTVISPSETLPFSVARYIPKMDFVCEHENRLWGCRYGDDVFGNKVNEIYASKLGDPKQWRTFKGLSTDSYTASCGSEGSFTGITSHLGYVVFFKENHIHRLFGTKPSNFKLYDDIYPGVKKGSERSLALLSGTLYYHSPVGICSYSGNAPVIVSRALGEDVFTKGVGAVSGNKYYVCLHDERNKPNLFVFDVFRGLWHREDDSDCIYLAPLESDILAVIRDGDTYTLESLIPSKLPSLCKEIYGKECEYEKDFDWCVETGLIGTKLPDNKYVSKMRIRLEAERGSSLLVSAEYDSCGIWETIGNIVSSPLKSVVLPITPKRCDHFRLKLTGKGGCKIYSLTKRMEKASEVI